MQQPKNDNSVEIFHPTGENSSQEFPLREQFRRDFPPAADFSFEQLDILQVSEK